MSTKGYYKGIISLYLKGKGYLSLSRYPYTLICFRPFNAYFGKDKGIDQKYPNNALMRIFKSKYRAPIYCPHILLKRPKTVQELNNFGGLNA